MSQQKSLIAEDVNTLHSFGAGGDSVIITAFCSGMVGEKGLSAYNISKGDY